VELGRRWGWHHQTVTRQLKRWQASGAVRREGKAVCAAPSVKLIRPRGKRAVRTSRYAPMAQCAVGVPDAPRAVAGTVNAIVLVLIGTGLGLVGLVMNVQFAATMATSRAAAAIFIAIGVCIDVIEVFGLGAAVSMWRLRTRFAGIVMATIWLISLAMTLIAGGGFISAQLGDTAAARVQALFLGEHASKRIAELEADRAAIGRVLRPSDAEFKAANDAVEWARTARAQECGKVGENCRKRAAELSERQSELAQLLSRRAAADGVAKIETELTELRDRLSSSPVPAEADPTAGLIRVFVRKISAGHLDLTDRQVRYLRVAGLASFPPLGGVLFGLGIALWSRIPRRR
jgi:hypothetical protein